MGRFFAGLVGGAVLAAYAGGLVADGRAAMEGLVARPAAVVGEAATSLAAFRVPDARPAQRPVRQLAMQVGMTERPVSLVTARF